MDFSVVIPTSQRQAVLKHTLRALTRCRYNKGNIEIIVVDNDVSAITRNIVREFAQKPTVFLIRYTTEKKKGPSFARNHGARIARYPHIVFLDDDVLVQPSLFSFFSSAIADHPDVSIIGGKTLAQPTVPLSTRQQNMFDRICLFEPWILGHIDYGDTSKYLDQHELLSTECLYVNRKQYGASIFHEKLGRKIGPFLIGSEDNELSLRTLSQRKKIFYVPRIITSHCVTPSRLSCWYIIQRMFFAGVDHRIVDTLMSFWSGYMPYSFNLRQYIQWRKSYDIRFPKNIFAFFLYFQKIIFTLGYYAGNCYFS